MSVVLGFLGWALGFGEIAKDSFAASLMSYCWTTGSCQWIVSALQSAGATFI